MVIAPQEDASKHADSGRIVIQSATNNLLIGLRILNPDPQFAEGFKAGLAMSRLGEEPRPVRFVEGLDREWSATPPRGMAYWECLAKILSEEPVREVDKSESNTTKWECRRNRVRLAERTGHAFFFYLNFP